MYLTDQHTCHDLLLLPFLSISGMSGNLEDRKMDQDSPSLFNHIQLGTATEESQALM
jgi:hypothetical protein